jgi:pimeloyl-ACP methyl ester carboxylesterase
VRSLPSTDGVTVAVHDLGGDGPPLLFAHATGFHGLVWSPMAAHLAESFHCWSFDERGHGDSPPPADGRFDWHGFGDDVLAVVDGLGLERPFAVGHSAGGAALLLAEEARPGTFRSLYCYEPIVLPVDPPIGPQDDNPLAVGALRRREVFASRDEAYANYSSKPPFNVLNPSALRAYVDHGFADLDDGTVRLKCRRENEAQTYRMGSAHNAYQRFDEVRCPVTLACGEHTDAITPAVLAVQAAALPSSRTEVMSGLGHFGPLQDPAAVAASVLRAFAEG